MLKVLQLIPTLDRSGAEKQMALLAAGLPRDAFHVEVAALTRLGPLRAELAAAGVPVTSFGKRFKLDPIILARLASLMKRGRFDVVQTWIFAANVYGRLAARLARVPVVVTAEMAVDLWKSPTHLSIDRRLAAWTDRVVGNSRAVVEFYHQKAGVPREKLTLIYSGIDNEPVPDVDRVAIRAQLGWPADAPILLFVGRLAEQKAVDDLIRAADLLQHILPELRTLIIGDGPQREMLQTMAHDFELDRALTFLGHRDDVPTFLAACDILVLPSLYEGLPNVVLEAMKFGKPVVATAAPGTTEVVIPDQTGLLVPTRDHLELARALRTVLGDPALARRLGEAGRARVTAEFQARTMIDEFGTLYAELARAKGVV